MSGIKQKNIESLNHKFEINPQQKPLPTHRQLSQKLRHCQSQQVFPD